MGERVLKPIRNVRDLRASSVYGSSGRACRYGPAASGREVSTSSMAALSRTLREMTPSVAAPCRCSATEGPAGTSPRPGLRPNSPQHAAGMRIDPPPSLAPATGTMPAATAAAAPPDEPPGVRLRSQGLRVGPFASGSVMPFAPNSGVLVLPKITSPESSHRSTTSLCRSAGRWRRDRLPLPVGSPA